MPRASVVIPTYDQPAYLLEALESVFAQTRPADEIIVVDDGSGPDTRAALEPLLGRLRYVRQANAGQAAARNRGAREAGGDVLAFLDHDDRWEPDYLATGLAYLDAHPDVGVLAMGQRLITAAGEKTSRVIRKKTPGPRYTTRSLLAGDVGTIVNPLVRRAAFESVGGYDVSIHGPEDCDLWLRLSLVTEIHQLPEPRLLYRVHPANTSKDMLTNAREWLRLLDKLERAHPEVPRAYGRLWRRNRGKQWLRLGREALRRATVQPEMRGEALDALRRSVRCWPWRGKPWLYLALASLPGVGAVYAGWRRRELALRDRFLRTRLFARLTDWRYGRLPHEEQRPR